MLKPGGIAAVMVSVAAFAAKNEAMRRAMKYKSSPEEEKQCSDCLQFIPGKTSDDIGGCKVFAGDTEISPKGYCGAWAKKA